MTVGGNLEETCVMDKTIN